MQSLIGGRYQVGNRLGSYENRVDYLGFDRQMHRMVLLQIYGPIKQADKEARKQLSDVANAAKAATGRNVLAVFDALNNRNELVLVREYMPSESLRKIIDEEGPFHPDDVSALIEQLSAGLTSLHKSGLQMPDLSADSVSVDQAGVVRIDPADAMLIAGKSRPSQSGGVQLAPELTTGGTLDERSEVFALANLAYEMLTGQLPHSEHRTERLKTDWETPENPSMVMHSLDPRVDPIVLKALSYNPDDRQPTTQQFASDLNSWSRNPIQLRAVPPPTAQTVSPPPPKNEPEAEVDVVTDSNDYPESLMVDLREWKEDAASSANWPLLLVSGLLLIGLIGAIVYGTRHLLEDDPSPTPAPSATASVVAASGSPGNGAEAATVPDVVGQPVQQARTTLESAGFTIQVVGDPPQSVQDRIGSQVPAAGSQVARGSEVQVQIAANQPIDLATLEIIGQPADLTQQTLQSLGLVVTRTEESSCDVPEGQVIRTEPEGTVQSGDNITLVVSRGDKVQIPASIQGAPLDQAIQDLTDLGITVTESIPVSAETIQSFGIDLEAAGITDQAVVGIQNGATGFGEWVESGTSVTLVYYDQSLDGATPSA